MARKIKMDFTGVEAYSRCSEGIHRAKIAEIQEKTSQGGDDMLQIKMEVAAGADKGCTVFDNCVLTDKALWKLKQLLTAIGVKCDGKVAVDLDNLIGKMCEIEVSHEEYNGSVRARITNYSKIVANVTNNDDDNEDDEEEEEEEEVTPKKAKIPAKTTKKPVKKQPEPEPAEDEEEEEEDEEEEEAPKPSKKSASAKKTPEKKAPAKKKPEPEEEEDEDDDDDWEEA